ncbi:hypothetical protein E4U14_000503 [Claviceps sp. LM454 group G7]|nr:hypothetical protein E4U14_000503 [Claviceps sp. LM454 group G7]
MPPYEFTRNANVFFKALNPFERSHPSLTLAIVPWSFLRPSQPAAWFGEQFKHRPSPGAISESLSSKFEALDDLNQQFDESASDRVFRVAFSKGQSLGDGAMGVMEAIGTMRNGVV